MAGTRFPLVAHAALDQWRRARRRVLEACLSRRAVHEWRICTRRLLALEALLAPRRSGASPRSLDEELHAAFHASGKLRDAQLTQRVLRELAQSVPEAAQMARHQEKRTPELARRLQRRLRKVRPRDLAGIVDAWLTPQRGDAGALLARRAAQRLRDAAARCMAAAPQASGITARGLHRRRIHLKLLRYMAELARDAGIPVPRSLSPLQLAALQKGLGAVTDLDMALRTVARLARQHPRWRSAAGKVRHELLGRRAAALQQLPPHRRR